jgi:lycopene cyclase domain-containing protein
MPLYLIINIASISIPLLFSFDKRVHFYRFWKVLFPALLISMVLFISWDVIFTAEGIWGFNEQYHSHIKLLGLPLEEFLFFITVPYASIFSIYVLRSYFPNFRLSAFQARIVSMVLIVALLAIAAFNIRKAYTSLNFLVAALLIGWVWMKNPEILRGFYLHFLVILIPFGIVNGILTGSFIEGEVVWYNDLENLGIRLGTIPVEDVFYGFSLILLNYFLMESFQKRSQPQKKST